MHGIRSLNQTRVQLLANTSKYANKPSLCIRNFGEKRMRHMLAKPWQRLVGKYFQVEIIKVHRNDTDVTDSKNNNL